MLRSSAFIAVAFLAATPALAQPAQGNAQYQEAVYLTDFNLSADTYSGQVRITASPCPNVTFSVSFNFNGVKDADAARDTVRVQVAKIAEDIKQAAAHCSSH